MPTRPFFKAWLTAAAVIVASHPTWAQAPAAVPLQILLDRAAAYTDAFMDRFSNVVAEESYVQDSSVGIQTAIPNGRGFVGTVMPLMRHRLLKSDFLLVRAHTNYEWVPFRDVFEVDGVPVRDREQRLAKLFLSNTPDSNQAERIQNESARFNLGGVDRSVNNPILPLMVLRFFEQARFRFTDGKRDPALAAGVQVVDFKEIEGPALVLGTRGIDIYSSGHLWIDGETGRLVKAEVALDQPGMRARIVTTFTPDDRFAIAVPSTMQERYDLDGGGRLTATATYGRFRRFDVTTDEKLGADATR